MPKLLAMLIAGGMVAGASALAQAQGSGSGPVGSSCAADIAKFCADKKHVGRQVRTCLEARRAELSDDCRTAIENTGGGRGMGRNRSQ